MIREKHTIDAVKTGLKQRPVLKVSKRKIHRVPMRDVVIMRPVVTPIASSIKSPVINSFVIRQRISFLPKGATAFKLLAAVVLGIFASVPTLSAFEAHVVNVTAVLKQIDAPVLTPPGSLVAWDDTNGGSSLTGTVNVVMTDADLDATHIFYTFGDGLDPDAIPNPVCGQPQDTDGGGDVKTEIIQLSLHSDSVIKAIACDGNTGSAHKSVTNTKVYDFDEAALPPSSPDLRLVINEFVPNPVGDDDAPMPGGEWVELYNNSTTTIDVDGWVLYDDDDDHELVISLSNINALSTAIAPAGFLVVYRDDDFDFALNNDIGGDTVRLFDGPILTGTLADFHTYTGKAPVGKSYARVPDGSTNWVDPCPTPDAPNVSFECPSEELSPIIESASVAATSDSSVISDSISPIEAGNEATTSTPGSIATTTLENIEQTGSAPAVLEDASVQLPDGLSDIADDPVPVSDEPASVPEPKREEAVLPAKSDQPEIIEPAPIAAGGDTPPPDVPESLLQASSSDEPAAPATE